MPSDVAVSAFPFPSPENHETKPVEPVLLRVSKKPAATIARFYKPYPFSFPAQEINAAQEGKRAMPPFSERGK